MCVKEPQRASGNRAYRSHSRSHRDGHGQATRGPVGGLEQRQIGLRDGGDDKPGEVIDAGGELYRKRR
jgi:hypothetical protein